jgi:hypothetical protein
VVNQIDAEMAARARAVGSQAENDWEGLLAEGVAYIEMALEPEVQRIVLLDGPAFLGDPSQWPSQNNCLRTTLQKVEQLIAGGIVKPMDAEAAARLLNGAALNAALWVAASDHPQDVLAKAVEAFRFLAGGLLAAPIDAQGVIKPRAGDIDLSGTRDVGPLQPDIPAGTHRSSVKAAGITRPGSS